MKPGHDKSDLSLILRTHLKGAILGKEVCQEPGRTYRLEFKQEAVQLTKQAGDAVTQVVRDLEINAAILVRWRREFGRRRPKTFLETGTPYDQELVRLKRELAFVTRKRDFLKEAAVFFAKTSR